MLNITPATTLQPGNRVAHHHFCSGWHPNAQHHCNSSGIQDASPSTQQSHPNVQLMRPHHTSGRGACSTLHHPGPGAWRPSRALRSYCAAHVRRSLSQARSSMLAHRPQGLQGASNASWVEACARGSKPPPGHRSMYRAQPPQASGMLARAPSFALRLVPNSLFRASHEPSSPGFAPLLPRSSRSKRAPSTSLWPTCPPTGRTQTQPVWPDACMRPQSPRR